MPPSVSLSKFQIRGEFFGNPVTRLLGSIDSRQTSYSSDSLAKDSLAVGEEENRVVMQKVLRFPFKTLEIH